MIAYIIQNGILDIYLTNQAIMLFIFQYFKSNLSFDYEKPAFYQEVINLSTYFFFFLLICPIYAIFVALIQIIERKR
jgi:hypothetical protein